MASVNVNAGDHLKEYYQSLAKQVTLSPHKKNDFYARSSVVELDGKEFVVYRQRLTFGPFITVYGQRPFETYGYVAHRNFDVWSTDNPFLGHERHVVQEFFTELNQYSWHVKHGNLDSVKASLARGIPTDFDLPDMPKPFESALALPEDKAESIVAEMLNNGFIPKAKHLHLAIKANQCGVIDQLLSADIDVNAAYRNQSPIVYAIVCDLDARPDCYEPTALHLMAKGAKTNKPLKNNLTLLHVAAQRGMPKLVNALLVEYPEWADKVTIYGDSPLHHALVATPINIDIVRKLLGTSVDVNRPNSDMQSPLVTAARAKRADVVWALLDAKAKVLVNDMSSKAVRGKQPTVYDTVASCFPAKSYSKLHGKLTEALVDEEVASFEMVEMGDADDTTTTTEGVTVAPDLDVASDAANALNDKVRKPHPKTKNITELADIELSEIVHNSSQ